MTQTKSIAPTHSRPAIVIAEEDLEALSDVAENLLDVLPDVGRFLDDELTRARLSPLRAIPPEVVTMNATVEFVMGQNARAERMKLVYPVDYVADGSCVSIASTVGVALLGLREGQTISWLSRHGDTISLKVLKIVSR